MWQIMLKKKGCEALVRRAVGKKKRESFKSFAENLDRFCDMKYEWNRMNVFKHKQNTQKWNPSGDQKYVDIALREVNRVAPQ